MLPRETYDNDGAIESLRREDKLGQMKKFEVPTISIEVSCAVLSNDSEVPRENQAEQVCI